LIEIKSTETERWCAVLIDMQEDFTEILRSGETERIVANQILVLRHCRENDIPMIVLEYRNHGDTLPELAAEIKKNRTSRYFIKGHDDGFIGCADLDDALRQLGVTHLFLMGINSCSCVKATAEGALRNGYQIATSDDVISSAHKPHNNIKWYVANGTCFAI